MCYVILNIVTYVIHKIIPHAAKRRRRIIMEYAAELPKIQRRTTLVGYIKEFQYISEFHS